MQEAKSVSELEGRIRAARRELALGTKEGGELLALVAELRELKRRARLEETRRWSEFLRKEG